jgi:hypothetical protein
VPADSRKLLRNSMNRSLFIFDSKHSKNICPWALTAEIMFTLSRFSQIHRHWPAQAEQSTHQYAYNTRGEVAEATATDSELNLLPGRAFRYQYDAIGNRLSATTAKLAATTQTWNAADPEASQTTDYTATNALNQYQQISRPNPLHRLLEGHAHPDAEIEVTLIGGPVSQPSGAPAVTYLRWGPGMTAYTAEIARHLGAQPGWRKVTIRASRPAPDQPDQRRSVVREGWIWLPPAQEALTYDLDGNLTGDARWTYTWDAENRLTAMEERPLPPGSGIRPPRLRFERIAAIAASSIHSPEEANAFRVDGEERSQFGYDSQWRRVSKRVLEKIDETAAWRLRGHRLFLYDD